MDMFGVEINSVGEWIITVAVLAVCVSPMLVFLGDL